MTEASTDDCRARLDAGVLRPRARLLVGGSRLRVLRLSAAGVLALDGLLTGHDAPGADALRRRLLAAAMLVVDPAPGDRRSLTVVVPVLGAAQAVQPVLDSVPDGVA